MNHSPSFSTDTPFDYKLKKSLIADTLRILNLSCARKDKYLEEEQAQRERKQAETNPLKRQTANELRKEREDAKVKALFLKDKWENTNMGNFQNLYPLPRGASKEQD